MAAAVAKLYCHSHKISTECKEGRCEYRLWLRDDGTCSYASVTDVEDSINIVNEDEDDKNAPYGQIIYEVSWGRYERVEPEEEEKTHFGKVKCKWAQRWQSCSYYDRRNPPSVPSPWKQSKKKQSSSVDLDLGPPGTTEGDVSTAAKLGSTLGLAEPTSTDYRCFPSWPPADLTVKVITLTMKASTNGMLTVICTDLGGDQCAVFDVDSQTQTYEHLRSSVANSMELDRHQLKMVLPDGTLLEVSDNDRRALVESVPCLRPEGIRQFYVSVDEEEFKMDTLCDLLDMIDMASGSQAVVFCNTRRKAEYILQQMTAKQVTALTIHADLEQCEREIAMHRFNAGLSRVLILTDMHGFNSDLQHVPLVINYDLATNIDDYLCRGGLSGCFGGKGIVINFVMSNDVSTMRDIEKHYLIQIEELPLDFPDMI